MHVLVYCKLQQIDGQIMLYEIECFGTNVPCGSCLCIWQRGAFGTMASPPGGTMASPPGPG